MAAAAQLRARTAGGDPPAAPGSASVARSADVPRPVARPADVPPVDAVRRPHRDNDDARAVRTRQRLVAAFHAAVQDPDPAALSVSALTRRAGVNRTSFYEHFASPDDLAVHALADLFDVVSSADLLRRGHGVDPATASRMGLRDVVDFVWARRATYARVLGPSAPPGLARRVSEAFAGHAAETFARLPQRPADADPRLTAHFVAGGVLTVLGIWLTEPRRRWSRDRLVTALLQCLPAWVTGPEATHHRTGASGATTHRTATHRTAAGRPEETT